MNPIINLIVSIILAVIFALSLKVSARLLRYQEVTWKQSIAFGVIGVATSLLASFLIQPKHAVIIGLPMNLLLGGWFFRQRGIKRSGERLGWPGAALLTGIALFLLAITMIILFNAFQRH